MVTHGGHTVDAPDGVHGLPFVNWSTAFGDLRVAHFFALHSLQAFPLLGLLISHTSLKAVPGYEKAYIVSSGPNFGTRQSRRVNGKYQVTEGDLTGGARQEDVVALGAWPMEYHQGPGKPVIWKQIKDQGTFDIPLRALTSVDTDNLYSAGRLVDGDKSAGAAMRVMGTSLGTGHAAGVAAALQAHGSMDVQAVQAELKRQGATLRTEGLPTFSAAPNSRMAIRNLASEKKTPKAAEKPGHFEGS